MYPHELIGKLALRKKPVKVAIEKVMLTKSGDMDYCREVIDYTFTQSPILILAATDSHIVYINHNSEEKPLLSEFLDSVEFEGEEGLCECEEGSECERFDECEECGECKECGGLFDGEIDEDLSPNILNSLYIDNEWADFSVLMDLADKHDIVSNILNEFKEDEEGKE